MLVRGSGPPPGPESEGSPFWPPGNRSAWASMERVAVEVDARIRASDDETQLIEGDEDDKYRMPALRAEETALRCSRSTGRRRVLPCAMPGDDELGIFMSSSSVPHVHPVDVQSLRLPRAGLC